MTRRRRARIRRKAVLRERNTLITCARACLDPEPTTEMNALDFSEVMRMKRERGEMREVLA